MRRGAPVVIGVGNDFRHDDGAGPAVVSALLAARDALPKRLRLAVCDGEPTRMIELWDHAGLAIVIDAAAPDPDAGWSPGDVVRWEMPGAEVDADREPHASGNPPPTAGSDPPAVGEPPAGVVPSIRSDSAGTHALGPGTAFRLARVLDRLPERLVLLAIVGADFRPGPGLSEAVADTVANVARQVAAELRQGLSARSGGDLGPWPGSRPETTLKP